MMSSSSMIRVFVVNLFTAFFLIQGCSSDGAITRFYVLDPIADTVVLEGKEDGTKSPSVEIVSLNIPQYLERPQIVTRNGLNELSLAELHQWGGNLRKNMIRVLAKNLSRLLSTADISTSRRNPRTPADFRLEVEIIKFERDPDGKVSLVAQWRLMAGKDQNPIATRITDIKSSKTLKESDYGQVVSAMESLLGELSVIIGNEILKNVKLLHTG